MAVALTLTKAFLAEAIKAKKTTQYARQDTYKGRSYEKEIFPQARMQFREYDKLYPTNEEFTEYFVRDLNRKDSQLARTLGAKTLEKILSGQSVEEIAEVSEQVTGGAPDAMTGGGIPSIPSAPFAPSAPRIIHNIPHAPQIPSFLQSAGKNLASQTSIGINRGLTRTASGFSNILGGIARGGGSLLSGLAGGGGRLLGGAGIRGLYSLAAFSNQATIGSWVKGPPVKFWLIFLAAFLLVGTITAISSTTQPTPTVEAGPTTGVVGLDYTLPLRDPSIVPLDIRNQVKATFPGAKLEYWDDPIIKRSIEAKWNPAFVLALWIEETGASQTTLIQNGGSEVPVAGKVSKGHLGCAPAEDQTIDESLTCLFKNFSQYTNDQFPQFMAAYSSGPTTNPFANNPNFPKNIKEWYSKMVPSGPGAIKPVTITAVASCPVPGGSITTPSYDENNKTGHCGQDYVNAGFICPTDSPSIDPTQTRRAKSIDVTLNSTQPPDVYLPTISGKSVNWKYLGPLVISSADCEARDLSGGCGIGLMFQTNTEDGNSWTIHLIHMTNDSAAKFAVASQDTTYPSGNLVGKTAINHLHTTIGRNVTNITARYDPGWLASDFMCK